jgi:microcystin-dependent protein
MDDPFIGEIVQVAFGFPPKGFATSSGQLLPINQNQALFSLLGTSYGGNGQTTFALPDFQGRIPVHRETVFAVGQKGGVEAVTLTPAQLPEHSHPLKASNGEPTSSNPAGLVQARGGMYSTQKDTTMAGGLDAAGDGQPHENVPPFLVMPFCIALVGTFPSQS